MISLANDIDSSWLAIMREEQILSKGGEGSGNWNHAGRPGKRGGSSKNGVAKTLDNAIEEYGKINLGKEEINRMMSEEYDITQEDIDEHRRLLTDYGGNKNQQERADKQIKDHIKNDTSVGKALKARIDIETIAANKMDILADKKLEERKKSLKEDKELGLIDDEQYQESVESEELDIKERYRTIYRKGDTDSVIQSWTQNPEGADMGSGTVLSPDHKMTYKEALDDYKVLGGLVGMTGSPGEAEVTLIKRDFADINKGGEGSGNFGHAGRPGEKGGSLPKGTGRLSNEEKKEHFKRVLDTYYEYGINKKYSYEQLRSMAAKSVETADIYGQALSKTTDIGQKYTTNRIREVYNDFEGWNEDGIELQKELHRHEIQMDETVYRGVHGKYADMLRNMEVGEVHDIGGRFASTSRSKEVTDLFQREDGYKMNINVKKGQKGAFIAENASEIILPAYTKLKKTGENEFEIVEQNMFGDE